MRKNQKKPKKTKKIDETCPISDEIICKQYVNYHFKFKDGFECAVDNDGIIWIKENNEKYFDRLCMKYCFTEIKIRNEDIAKFILKKSCEIQDNKIITKRANGYL